MTNLLLFESRFRGWIAPRRAPGRWIRPWWVTVLVWLLLGLSVAYWGLRGGQSTDTPPPSGGAAPRLDAQGASLAQALGVGASGSVETQGGAVAPSGPAHALLGVVTDARGHGVALLLPPGGALQPLRLGGRLPDGWRLQALGVDHAVLVAPEGAPEFTLKVPKRQ